jgi:hypothetical protein
MSLRTGVGRSLLAAFAMLRVLLVPGFSLAGPAPVITYIDISEMSFTVAGAIRVEMTYSCPNGFRPVRDFPTYLRATQQQSGGVVVKSPIVEFTDKIVCDGEDRRIVVRIHRVQDFNTSDRIELFVNFAVRNAHGEFRGGEDAPVVRPSAVPHPATTVAEADVRRVMFTSTGAIRVHFLYVCLPRFEALTRSLLVLSQVDAGGVIVRLANLVACDGTRRIAAATVPPKDAGAFVATKTIHPFVTMLVRRPTGAMMRFENGKDILVEPTGSALSCRAKRMEWPTAERLVEALVSTGEMSLCVVGRRR